MEGDQPGQRSRWAPERLDPDFYIAPGIDLPIFYGDLDTNRHLNNVNFGRFFEHSRYTAHLTFGLPKLLNDSDASMLVARVAIDYLAEAHFGTDMHVRTRIARLGRTSLVEEQAAWQDSTCVALAEVVVAHRVGGQAAEMSPELRAAFVQLQDVPIRPASAESR